MNNPNPFVPKGSILEQQSQRRSRLKFAVFAVITLSVAGLAVMLIQGCKRTPSGETTDNSMSNIDTNTPVVTDTNAPATGTNAPAGTNAMPPMAIEPPPVVPPPAPSVTEYTVVKGDILETIAKKNNVTLKALEAANPGVVPTKLKIGQKLVIPSGGASAPVGTTTIGGEVYVVKSGDTLTHIAKMHGTTVKAIQAENNLTTTRIIVGQHLKMPAKVEAAPASAPVTEPAPSVPATGTPAPATLPESTPGK